VHSQLGVNLIHFYSLYTFRSEGTLEPEGNCQFCGSFLGIPSPHIKITGGFYELKMCSSKNE